MSRIVGLLLLFLASASSAHATPVVTSAPPSDPICVLFLPLCLLDHAGDVTRIQPEQLLEQGYSLKSVQEILNGQSQVFAYMADRGLVSFSEISADPAELPRALDSAIPGLSPVYLTFLSKDLS